MFNRKEEEEKAQEAITRILSDLPRIFIRVKIGGKWESVSVADAPLESFHSWAIGQVFTDDGSSLTDAPEELQKAIIVKVLENMRGTPYTRMREG